MLGSGAALAGLGLIGAPRLWLRFGPRPIFEDIAGLPGFRRLAGGQTSGGGAVALIGVDHDAERIPASPCTGLFPERIVSGSVPVAYFSDARCIYCRTMSPMLKRMEEAGEIAVAWHELPLLSPASVVAARASIAARAQGAFDIFHQRLMGTPFLPTDPYLRDIARDAGIDPARLLFDMNAPFVEGELAVSAALARRFGFIGTPGMVIGRTVVLGQLSEAALARLLAIERAEAASGPCR